MDLPRPAYLGQLTLHLSAEGQRFAYHVADRGSGKILSVSREVLSSLRKLSARLAAAGGATPAPEVSEAEVREAYGALSYLQRVRDAETMKRKSFNPVMMQFALFDVAPFQPGLQNLARVVVGWGFVVAIFALALATVVLGINSDWAIGGEFAGILSLEALATFGLAAPVLKIIHEFGHVLAATRYGVRVRKAGLNLIGFYPLPYVDCSDADLSASRRQRIIISLAGLLTDIFIGLIAAVAWHFVQGDFAQTLAGRIFVFSTLNSLLFNANPLMKMDGYYAVVDAMGQRNLSMRATKAFADFRLKLLTLGKLGAWPITRAGLALVAFGLATFFYRLYVVYTLFSHLVPVYLGLGLIVAIWGAYVMFLSPILADRAAPPVDPATAKAPGKYWGRRLVFCGLAALLLLLPLRYVQRIDLRPDVTDNYLLTTAKAGFVAAPPYEGGLNLANPRLAADRVLQDMAIAEADLTLAAYQGLDPAKAQAAQDNRAAALARAKVLDDEIASLTLQADAAALIIWDDVPRVGRYLQAGTPVAQVYPTDGNSILVGEFPERWVTKFDSDLAEIELRFNGTFIIIPRENAQLVEQVSLDHASGVRNFRLRLMVPMAPADLVGQDVKARLVFAAEPLWKHLRFWLDGQITAFRDAQIADRAKVAGSR